MTEEQIEKLKQLVELAKEVRVAQRVYFKTRSKDALINSKRLETALDIRLLELERMGVL